MFNYYRNLFGGFRDAGYDVYAFAPRDGHEASLEALGCRYIPLPLRPHSRNPFRELAALWTMFRVYRSLRPSAVFHFTIKCNLYGAFSAQALSIPHVNNVSGLGNAFSSRNVFNRGIQQLYRLAQKRCARVFFQNPADLEYMRTRGLVSAAQAMLLPGSGVNLDAFAPEPRLRGEPFTFVFIGRLLWEKGLDDLAEALRTLRRESVPVRCLVFGFLEAGNSKFVRLEDLRAWEAEGLLEFRGPVQDARVAYRLADCVILPTYYREGVPKSLLEAMAMAKPVLATDIAGCRQAVRHEENGLLCPPRDAGALAQAMRRLSELEPSALERMGRKGREIVEERFGEERVHSEYLRAAGALSR